MKKTLFVVLDGLPDEPHTQWGNLTPLQKANTPFFDRVAKTCFPFLLKPLHRLEMPTSEEGHFALFGYHPLKYPIKRGWLEAATAEIPLKEGDIALRGNLATLDTTKYHIIDRRAQRIDIPSSLLKEIGNREIEGVKIKVAKIKGHRLVIVLQGKGLSEKILGNDPKYENKSSDPFKVTPLSTKALKTARILERFLVEAHAILRHHPLNIKRVKEGKRPANIIICRGAGKKVHLESFSRKWGYKRIACVAGNTLQKTIGKILGMEVINVPGATGLPNTNIEGKVKTALDLLQTHDFVFLHFKGTDTLAEDGRADLKAEYITKVNKAFEKYWKEQADLLIITSDHGTSSLQKAHFDTLIPALVWVKGKRGPGRERFTEKEFHKGGETVLSQEKLLEEAISLLN